MRWGSPPSCSGSATTTPPRSPGASWRDTCWRRRPGRRSPGTPGRVAERGSRTRKARRSRWPGRGPSPAAASSRSGLFAPRRLPPPSPQAQAQHGQESATYLVLRDLGRAGDTVLEFDGHLDHLVAEAARAEDHLDLKGVPLRAHLVEPDVRQQVSGVAAVAGGGVVRLHTQQQAAVGVGALRQQPAPQRPSLDRAAGNVSRAEGQPAALAGRVHDRLQVLWPVRYVGVHLHEQLRTVFEAEPERVLVGAAQPQLAGTVQHAHAWIGGSELVGNLPRAVGGAVVDDHHVVAQLANRAHHTLNVLVLVVRRQHHEDLGRRRLARGDAHLLGAYRRKRTPTRSLNMSSEWRMAATLVGAECRHTTGTSAMRAPRFLARNSASGS